MTEYDNDLCSTVGFCIPGASKANVASSTSSLSAAAWAFPIRPNAGVINLLGRVQTYAKFQMLTCDMCASTIYLIHCHLTQSPLPHLFSEHRV